MSEAAEARADYSASAVLAERFPGVVIGPRDRQYGAARTLWNASIDHLPAAIARPRTARDVAAAILSAREMGLEIAVRCGGHSVAGHSMSDGGLTIDLSAMNQVEIDSDAATARVGGGALLNDVADAAAPHDLAIPYGHVSHTGVGGFTLGAGIGWIMRRYGLAIDSLRSAQVVTADGALVTATGEQNPDLFWALRGGGGNFGVVTEFEFDLHPHGPFVLAGMVLHPLEQAHEVLRFSRDFMDQAPEEITVFETFMTVPPAEPFPAELRGKPAFALGVVYAGEITQGERALAELRAFGRPALDLVAPMLTLAVQRMLDPTAPHGMRNHNKAHWLRELPDQAIDELVARHAAVTSPMSLIVNARMGGAIDRVPAGETAFGYRDANRLLWAISAWWEGDAAEHVDWCQGVFDAMTPYSTGGVYVNALGDEGAARISRATKKQSGAGWSRSRAAGIPTTSSTSTRTSHPARVTSIEPPARNGPSSRLGWVGRQRSAAQRLVQWHARFVVAPPRLVVGEDTLPTMSRRLRTPVFSKMLLRCCWTVCVETISRSAIFAVDSPWSTRRVSPARAR